MTLCNPLDCSLPGSSVQGISQARILSMLPFPTLGDLPDPGIKPESLVSPVLAGRFFITAPPVKPLNVPSYSLLLFLPFQPYCLSSGFDYFFPELTV